MFYNFFLFLYTFHCFLFLSVLPLFHFDLFKILLCFRFLCFSSCTLLYLLLLLILFLIVWSDFWATLLWQFSCFPISLCLFLLRACVHLLFVQLWCYYLSWALFLHFSFVVVVATTCLSLCHLSLTSPPAFLFPFSFATLYDLQGLGSPARG